MELRNNPLFVGIRPMIQDIPDDSWGVQPRVLKNIEVICEHDFPIDLLVKPRHLPIVLELLETFPELRAVIDHLGKPLIGQQVLEPWQAHMSVIPTNPRVMCKLSGMLTEVGRYEWNTEGFLPYVKHVLSQFGAGRVMFGSDWPVCLEATSYQEVYQLLNNLLYALRVEEAAMAQVFGRNAMTFYKLDMSQVK